MTRPALTAIAVIGTALLCAIGCSTTDYVVDASDRVKAANWEEMETVQVILKEYSFAPSKLTFREGVPYKLRIANEGTAKHYFTAPEFFKAIATRKVQSNADGEIKAPYFLALEVFPRRSLDLYFVPVKKGKYPLLCTIKGHAEHGMTGSILVE